jgi:hypothetical protein
MPITEGGRFSPVDRIVSPGVFTRENDLSGIAQGVADIGGAILAPFPKGPAFAPTLVRSVNELEEKFGVADGVYYGPYTAKQYLTERGLVTVCRVGALTGYKQNYPFVIWAIKGEYNRNNTAAALVSQSSAFYPSAGDYSNAYSQSFLYIPHVNSSSYLATGAASTSQTVYSSTITSSGQAYVGVNMELTSSMAVSGTFTLKFAPDPVVADVSNPNLTGSLGSPTYNGQTVVFTNVVVKTLKSYNRISSSFTGDTFKLSGSMTVYREQLGGSDFTLNTLVYDTTLAKNLWSGSAYYPPTLVSGSSLYVAINTSKAITIDLGSSTTVTNTSEAFNGNNGSDLPTLVSASMENVIGACGVVPLWNVKGYLSGSFGQYNGTFTPVGTPTYDVCTNTWTTGNADYRILAVLADTQNGTISDLVAPGFSGSVFVQGSNASVMSSSIVANSYSSSISKEFAIQLKSSNSTAPYGVYGFSLDSSNPKYITNVFGKDPRAGDPAKYATGTKKEAAYLYKIFENTIDMVMADNNKYFISGSFLPNGNALWAGDPVDFTDDYSRNLNTGDSQYSITHAATPWIISQAVASWDGSGTPTRFRLFKVHTLADGTDTNTSYKVEISNVKLAGQVAGSDWGSFTLSVRKYSDTDKKPVILETFQNLNLDPDSSNYVARRIGDRYNYINFAGKIIEFGTYTNLSKYIRIESSTNPAAITAVPAGFEALVTPINSSMGNWVSPIRYSRASIYGIDPGKYPSGVAFNDAPTGADSELAALYPTASVGNGTADDNLQYFAPLPKFGSYTSIGRN